MKRLLDPVPRPSARRARATFSTALLLLAALALAASAVALDATPRAAAGDLQPFLGVWHEAASDSDGQAPGLDLEIRAAAARPEAILTLYNKLRGADGKVTWTPVDAPAYDVQIAGSALTFRTRYVMRFREGSPKSILDNGMRLELTGKDEAVLRWIEAHHRKDLPPPPPPIPLKRQG